MNRLRNGRAQLLEMLIVIMFFALCASIALKSMLAVSSCTQRAAQKRIALRELKEDAAFLLNTQHFEDALSERGYVYSDDAWAVQRDDMIYRAALNEEQTEAGVLMTAQLSVYREDEALLELPVSRYLSQGGQTDE